MGVDRRPELVPRPEWRCRVMGIRNSLRPDSSSDGDNSLDPEQIRAIIKETKEKIEMNRIGGDEAKADLFRIQLAISLWSLAGQNHNSRHGEFIMKKAARWSQSQLTQVDNERLTRRLNGTRRDADPSVTQEQSTENGDGDRDQLPGEVRHVISLATDPERSLDALEGEDLHREIDKATGQVLTASLLSGQHGLFSNKNLACILFTGPPGTGKTHAAEGLANRLQSLTEKEITFLPLTGTNLKSHLYGKSQQIVEGVFQWANENGPTVVFIDEFDEIATRDRHEETQAITNTILKALDGATAYENLILVGATNRPEDIDMAMDSRFRTSIEFTEPPAEVKPTILYDKLDGDGVKLTFERTSLSEFEFDGLVGRDLATAAETAITEAHLSRGWSATSLPIEVGLDHVQAALETVGAEQDRTLESESGRGLEKGPFTGIPTD